MPRHLGISCDIHIVALTHHVITQRCDWSHLDGRLWPEPPLCAQMGTHHTQGWDSTCDSTRPLHSVQALPGKAGLHWVSYKSRGSLVYTWLILLLVFSYLLAFVLAFLRSKCCQVLVVRLIIALQPSPSAWQCSAPRAVSTGIASAQKSCLFKDLRFPQHKAVLKLMWLLENRSNIITFRT